MLLGHEYKPFEPGAWTGASTTKRSTTIHAGYGAPSDPEELRAPFDAMAIAGHSRCAQALLSSAWSLYVAGSTPNPLEWTDRLLLLYTAVMALCEPPGEPARDEEVFGRWQHVAERAGVWSDLTERGYSAQRIQQAHARIRDARNIATHGSDSVLVNLGYPAEATRTVRGPREVPGADLALAVIRADWGPLLFAARAVTTELWCRAQAENFDDGWFEDHFQ